VVFSFNASTDNANKFLRFALACSSYLVVRVVLELKATSARKPLPAAFARVVVMRLDVSLIFLGAVFSHWVSPDISTISPLSADHVLGHPDRYTLLPLGQRIIALTTYTFGTGFHLALREALAFSKTLKQLFQRWLALAWRTSACSQAQKNLTTKARLCLRRRAKEKSG